MVFARNQATQAILQQNWKKVAKRYLAVVDGVPANGQGTLKDHLVESNSFMVHRVDKGGELAITHYRVLRRHEGKSLLELTLETGRKNQVRVQLAALGHPIIGDRKYGASSDPARRLALHSCELTFRHPVSGALMEFHSGLPAQLEHLFEPARSTRVK
jgi:23S rRNA-/tRNA-specific pseudouridylate synthase